jgi:hypothetical protein
MSWSRTQNDLAYTFQQWGVKDWDTDYPRGARLEGFNQSVEDRTVTLKYTKDGQKFVLSMGKQARAIDNLRVLYIAMEAIRMNERRGIGELLASVYLQLAAGASGKKSPYEVLGLGEGLPLIVYEAMYKSLALKYHPDRNKDPDAEIKMAELNEALEEIRKL